MQVYEQMTPREQELEKEQEALEERAAAQDHGYRLTLAQAVVCALLLLATLLLRAFIPALYGEARSWYDQEMSRSIVITADDVSNS